MPSVTSRPAGADGDVRALLYYEEDKVKESPESSYADRPVLWSATLGKAPLKMLRECDWLPPCFFESSPERGTIDITTEIEIALSALRLHGILIPRPAEIRRYLLRFPDMTDVLRSAAAAALRRLGAEAQLSVQLYSDPEIDDTYLTVYVRQEHYDESVLEAIDEASAAFEDALGNTSGWLLVTTDFGTPL